MKKNGTGLILLSALLSCQQPETITREEALAAIRLFDEAWQQKKPASVDSVLSPAYIYFTQSGGSFDRANVVQTAGSAEYVLDSMQRKEIEIKIDQNTAVVNTVWTARGSYFNKPFLDTQRCSITLLKKDGIVQILSEHCTPIK